MGGRLLGLLIVLLILPVSHAAVLCSYKGPDNSGHMITLTEFEVSGDEPLQPGSSLDVKFTLENSGKSELILGKYGIYIVADGSREGSILGGETWPIGQSVTWQDDLKISESGELELWPSYHLDPKDYGPEGWHTCSLQVFEKDTDNDGIPDSQDNCPDDSNQGQQDSDDDGIGDICDTCDDNDYDQDNIVNCEDDCPDEPENYNDYQDDDGCPDEMPEQEPDEGQEESDPPQLSTSETRRKGQVTFFAEAKDESGIAFIELFLDNLTVRKCFRKNCSITLHENTTVLPVFGAAAVDIFNNVETAGEVDSDILADLPSWFDDSDDDGVPDSQDNCIETENPEQLDNDNDGFGDECDGCTASSTIVCDVNYCCELYYSSCRDLDRFSSVSYTDVYYWEDFYDGIDDEGCGYIETDSGRDYFTRGDIRREELATSSIVPGIDGPPGSGGGEPICTGTSRCPVTNQDSCSSEDILVEYYFYDDSYTGLGLERTTVNCPFGCEDGQCVCGDTDEGWNPYNFGWIETYLGSRTRTNYSDDCRNADELIEYGCTWSSYDGFEIESRVVDCPYGCMGGACSCQDTDGGINFTVFGRIGGVEDHCEDDRNLVEYYTRWEEGDRDCDVRSRTYECEGLCEYGRCLPPTCEDGVRNQGEDDIDCGGPCMTCDLCSLSRSELPDNFTWRDWRGQDWTTPVGDQGDCGACWAFASVGVVEAKYNIEQTGMGETIDRAAQLNLSEQMLVSNCYGGGSCGGGGAYGGIREIRTDGIPDDPCFPYVERTSYCRPCSGWESRAWTVGQQRRAKRTGEGIRYLKKDIICEGPVSTCGSGHCVVLVGWDEDGWIIKNSWGTSWADQSAATNIGDGFGHIDYGHDWLNLDTQKYFVRNVREW